MDWFSSESTGYENVDLDAAVEQGNTPSEDSGDHGD